MTTPTFDEYLASLSSVSPEVIAAEPEALEICEVAARAIAKLDPLDIDGLATSVQSDPAIVPVIAASAGLSQERLRTWLQARFGTAGWVTLGRKQPADLVSALDEDFGIVDLLTSQVEREWTWADVLARVMAPRQRAGKAIQQGRALEDEVEAVVQRLGLAFEPRTRFAGTGGQDAPADFGIPGGRNEALIAVAVKGFDSTGSKLGDAMREIEDMAKVRKPTQFIFAIVDGHGWHRRQNDLRRIHKLWTDDRIDGVYNRVTLPQFEARLAFAARRLGLIDSAQ